MNRVKLGEDKRVGETEKCRVLQNTAMKESFESSETIKCENESSKNHSEGKEKQISEPF